MDKMNDIRLNEDKLDEVDLEAEDVTKENEDSGSSLGNLSSAILPSVSKEVSPEKEESPDSVNNQESNSFIPISNYSPPASPLSVVSSVTPAVQSPYTPQLPHYSAYSSYPTQTHVNQPLNGYYGQRNELRPSQHYYSPYYYQPQPMPYQGYSGYSNYRPASSAPMANPYPYMYNQNYENYSTYHSNYMNHSINTTTFNASYDRSYNYSAKQEPLRPSSSQSFNQSTANPMPEPLPLPSFPGNMPPNYLEWFEAYSRWYNKMYKRNEQGQIQRQRLTPLLYSVRHSRVNFGPLNQLVVASGQTLNLYHLEPHLIDIEGQLMISTWPGPLSKTETNKAELLEYIKSQEGYHQTFGEPLEVLYHNKEKKQIWRILLMLVRQNGYVSGSDLTELLLHFNEQDFQTDDEESTELSKFRKFLVLGQRKTGLEFATKNGLWDHALALTYLTTPQELMPSACPQSMLNIVSKFFNGSLDPNDPLFVLYQCLYQKKKQIYSKEKAKLLPTSNLQQFAILLANDCEVSSIISGSNYCSELLKFVISIRNNYNQHLINLSPVAYIEYEPKKGTKPRYSEELIFINEIYEYGRTENEIIYALIPFKVIFATKLFDFGLINQARKYCQSLRNIIESVNHQANLKEANVNCKLILRIINEIESRFKGSFIDDNCPDFFLIKDDETKVRKERSRSTSLTTNALSEQVEALSIRNDNQPISEFMKPVFESTSNAVETDKLTKTEPVTTAKETFSVVSNEMVEDNYLPQTSIKPTFQPSQPIQLFQSLQPAQQPQSSSLSKTSTSTYQSTYQPSYPSTVTDSKVTKWKTRKPSTSTISPQIVNNSNTETGPMTPKLQSTANPFPPTSIPFNFFGTEDDKTPHSSFSIANLSVPKQKFDEVENAESGTFVSSIHDVHKLNSTTNNLQPNSQMFSTIISPIVSPTLDKSQINSNLENVKGTNVVQDSNLGKDNWLKNETDDQAKDDKGRGVGGKSKGVIDYIISKVSSRGPKRAILPDDREPSIVWDKTLNRWVDKTLGDNQPSNLASNGPPKIPFVNQSMQSNDSPASKPTTMGSNITFQPLNPDQLQFTRSKKKRYVDILQQQR